MKGHVTTKPNRKGKAALRTPIAVAAAAILWFSGVALGQSTPGDSDDTQAPAQATSSATPERSSQPPTVTFQNGELTIVAFNSTLHDVLESVRLKTGAIMDIPPEATERVFVSLGPGPTRRVLDTLLAGSSFNYILMGSENDPQTLSRVMLSVKPKGNSEIVAEGPAPGPRRTESARVERQQVPAEDAQESKPAQQQASEASASPAGASTTSVKSDEVATADAREKTETAADLNSQSAPEGQSGEGTQTAAYPRTPNIKTAQEVLQDLYARRQAMQQQRQSSPQQ
ncbi:MAG: hypothetical protein JOZ10_19195 [Acidobacteria bacterium]|nr:hypothetical protein [Acidobacteriota bacterium]MBV9147103.1 hypothetical protein [Acidobacteriota bacterium]